AMQDALRNQMQEIGTIADHRRQEQITAAEAQIAEQQRAQAERRKLLGEVAKGFEDQVASVVVHIETMLTRLGDAANRMREAAASTQGRVSAAIAAANSANASASSVATASSDVAAHAHEVQAKTEGSRDHARAAVDVVTKSNAAATALVN